MKGENLVLNFLIRDLRSVARSFLYNVAPFPFFFLIDCTEHATLEDPLEGVDFAPPLFFLSFFFLPHPTEAQKKEYSRRNSQSISFHAYLTSFYV